MPPSVVLGLLRTSTAEEPRFAVDRDYAATKQANAAFIPGWRRQVVEWLFEVATEFSLDVDTVALAVRMFDRLLSRACMPPAQLQTAALACVYLAAKLHEMYPITTVHIKQYFSEICVAEDIRRAEVNILCYLGWDIDSFTACGFIRAVMQLVPDAAIADALVVSAEAYFRLAVLDYSLVSLPASVMGITCVSCACTDAGFDAQPLVDGLRAHGVEVKVYEAAVEGLHRKRAERVAADAAAAAAAAARPPAPAGDVIGCSPPPPASLVGAADIVSPDAVSAEFEGAFGGVSQPAAVRPASSNAAALRFAAATAAASASAAAVASTSVLSAASSGAAGAGAPHAGGPRPHSAASSVASARTAASSASAPPQIRGVAASAHRAHAAYASATAAIASSALEHASGVAARAAAAAAAAEAAAAAAYAAARTRSTRAESSASEASSWSAGNCSSYAVDGGGGGGGMQPPAPSPTAGVADALSHLTVHGAPHAAGGRASAAASDAGGGGGGSVYSLVAYDARAGVCGGASCGPFAAPYDGFNLDAAAAAAARSTSAPPGGLMLIAAPPFGTHAPSASAAASTLLSAPSPCGQDTLLLDEGDFGGSVSLDRPSPLLGSGGGGDGPAGTAAAAPPMSFAGAFAAAAAGGVRALL